VRAVERQPGGTRLFDQLCRRLRKERELGEARPCWNRREREQNDAALGELREDAVRRSELVTDVRLGVLGRADRERHSVEQPPDHT